MNTPRRLVRPVNYNFVLYAVATVAILYVVTSRPVTDAIINFCFAGIVPGTDRVLSPDDMVLGETVLFGSLIMVLLLVWLFRRVSARRAVSRLGKALSAAASKPKVTKSKKLAVGVVKQETGRRHAPVARRRVSTQAIDYELVDRLAVTVSSLGASLKQDMRYAADMLAGIYWLLLGVVWYMARFVVRIIAIGLMTFGIVIATVWSFVKRSWRRLEPSLRRLDSWLEVQCRGALALASKKLKRSQSWQVVGLMVHDSKANLRNIFK